MATEQQQQVSDKTFPITNRWLLKPILSTFLGAGLISLVVVFLFTFYSLDRQDTSGPFAGGVLVIIIFAFALIGPFFAIIAAYIRRATFDYKFEDNFIVLHQGLISRSQRNIPFSVLQDVIIKQDLADRILGITTFIVENAVQDLSAVYKQQHRGKYSIDVIGFSGNKVVIPGLSKENALQLKEIVLQRMKGNQAHSSKTGGL